MTAHNVCVFPSRQHSNSAFQHLCRYQSQEFRDREQSSQGLRNRIQAVRMHDLMHMDKRLLLLVCT